MARAVVEESRRVAARFIKQAALVRDVAWVAAGDTFDLFVGPSEDDEVEVIAREYETPERCPRDSHLHVLAAARIPTKVGGRRWYWVCHGCSRRVDHLYGSTGKSSMKCRRCLGLVYRSQRVGWYSPRGLVRREGRLLARLEGTRSLATKESLLSRLDVVQGHQEKALWRLARDKVALLARVVREAEEDATPLVRENARKRRRVPESIAVDA
jgi:hypothetical protein